jgi:hypothetical protein
VDPAPARRALRGRCRPLTLTDVAFVDGDLGIQGERIDRVPDDWRHHVLSIAQERHRASNRLFGRGPIYSRVRTDP